MTDCFHDYPPTERQEFLNSVEDSLGLSSLGRESSVGESLSQ